jgi:Protein of unknown function (DUF3072)
MSTNTKTNVDQGGPSNKEKDPDSWTTGDETMTGAQASYLKTLCEEAGEEFDQTLTKAEASKRIDALQGKTGRGRSHWGSSLPFVEAASHSTARSPLRSRGTMGLRLPASLGFAKAALGVAGKPSRCPQITDMCGRYASFLPPEFLARLFATVNPLPNLQPTWNLAPTDDAPDMARSRPGGAEVGVLDNRTLTQSRLAEPSAQTPVVARRRLTIDQQAGPAGAASSIAPRVGVTYSCTVPASRLLSSSTRRVGGGRIGTNPGGVPSPSAVCCSCPGGHGSVESQF